MTESTVQVDPISIEIPITDVLAEVSLITRRGRAALHSIMTESTVRVDPILIEIPIADVLAEASLTTRRDRAALRSIGIIATTGLDDLHSTVIELIVAPTALTIIGRLPAARAMTEAIAGLALTKADLASLADLAWTAAGLATRPVVALKVAEEDAKTGIDNLF